MITKNLPVDLYRSLKSRNQFDICTKNIVNGRHPVDNIHNGFHDIYRLYNYLVRNIPAINNLIRYNDKSWSGIVVIGICSASVPREFIWRGTINYGPASFSADVKLQGRRRFTVMSLSPRILLLQRNFQGKLDSGLSMFRRIVISFRSLVESSNVEICIALNNPN